MGRKCRFSRPKVTASYSTYKLSRSVDDPKLDIPPIDENRRYWYLTHRHKTDKNHTKLPYDELNEINSIKRFVKPDREYVSREPSFTKFKVPFQMICQERYNSSVKRYDEQFCREINNLIDNQPTARQATYFVRVVSYTTLWPPYHNESEIIDTSRRFYALTQKERNRFHHIMSHDYSFT
ncbi:uncharacterized protein LOC117791010 [Drosophila innubila]|uniref:uncharacterized protein LOC117791010 n=1 Tax=Drosophila innubila TaxID=198719 RepID=UPI00148DDD16|nr:uncharacterized protein LOC117791010 [Drosophila innubila]